MYSVEPNFAVAESIYTQILISAKLRLQRSRLDSLSCYLNRFNLTVFVKIKSVNACRTVISLIVAGETSMVYDIIIAIHREDAIMPSPSPNIRVALQDFLRLSIKGAEGASSGDIAYTIGVISPSSSEERSKE